MIDSSIFLNLKKGDRVVTNLSGAGTVIEMAYMNSDRPMAKINCDKKKWSCPYFYQSEIKEIEK